MAARSIMTRSRRFQSTLSVRRATDACLVFVPFSEFQSALSVRRATHPNIHRTQMLMISIHALRKESDTPVPAIQGNMMISIHALRKESDFCCSWLISSSVDFNPRSP